MVNSLLFEDGYYKDSPVGNYKDYMAKKHDGLAQDLVNHFKFKKNDRIIDFGAATGNLIRELHKRGIPEAYGTDISYYAVQYGKEVLGLGDKLQYYNLELLSNPKDYVLMLDVLEHLPTETELNRIIGLASRDLESNFVVRIPVALNEGENYHLEVSRNDKTHFQCHSKDWWISLFQDNGLELAGTLNSKHIYDSKGVFSGYFQRK